ncbi:hypothetical protein ACHHYP_06931 [Achlya hypogyna]|uniref:Carbohydrate-binding domain-containing protein n=1 Tax=Achlya hypogyna TaxID=1202772 RepID=A0A1V9ZMX7_ACHHY|nr:hypothetical protein ACHHYP_06931 [Achlya hypogyna]
MAEWEYMATLVPPTYPCVRRAGSGRMELDGRLDKAEWAAAPWTDAFVDIEGAARKPSPPMLTRAKMMWDDAYLYVGAVMEEPKVWGTLVEKNSVMYHENDFEIFIDPDGSHHNYYEFEMNCLNTIWELVLHKPYKDGHDIDNPSNLRDIHSAVHIDGVPNDPRVTCRQWSVEVALPLAELVRFDERRHRQALPGDTWRMNFSRVHYDLNTQTAADGRATYVKVPGRREYNFVWAATGVIDIHRPEKWALVHFLGTPTVDTLVWERTIARLRAELAIEDTLNCVYYAQRMHKEAHGAYAPTLSVLFQSGAPANVSLEVRWALRKRDASRPNIGGIRCSVVPRPDCRRGRASAQHHRLGQVHQAFKETRTGSSLRQPFMRVATALLLLVLNVIVHHVNPVALSHAPAFIPLYGMAFNFLCRSNLPEDSSSTYATRVIVAIVSLVLGGLIARFVVFPLLHRSWTMFSAGHASFRTLKEKDLAPPTYRHVSGDANDGKLYEQDVYIGSSSQGSWAVIAVVTPIFMVVVASIYNCIIDSTLQVHPHVTSAVEITYVALYPAVRAVSFAFNALLLFAVLDTMLQDHHRCDALYGGWMHSLRSHVWRHQACRISFFWLYLAGVVAFAARGLPAFSAWVIDRLLDAPDYLLIESWRAFLSGLVVVLDIVVLMQDWDFPTLATVKGVHLPGLAVENLTLRKGRRQLVLTGKWLVMSLALWMLPVDVWVLGQQLGYTPSRYGQLVDAASHRIVSVTNTTWLTEHRCGAQCFGSDVAAQGADTAPTMGRYFGWPLLDQMPAVYIVAIALFMFARLAWTEDSRFEVATQMQGVKATTYSEQLKASALTAKASDGSIDTVAFLTPHLALRQLASIKHMYSLRKHVDGVCILLAFLGVILMLLQLHTIWEGTLQASRRQFFMAVLVDVVFGRDKYSANALSAPGQTYSLLIAASTLVLVSQLVARTRLTLAIAKLRHKVPMTASVWRHPTMRVTLLLEVIANLWIVPPFVTGFMTTSEFQFEATTCTAPMVLLRDGCYYVLRYPVETLGLAMLLRLYWVVRLVRNHSGFYGQRVDFLGSLHNVSTDSPLWHFRAVFHHRPVFAFVACTLVVWLATAAGVSVMERSIPSALDSDLTASWLVVVTMATVGYGDYYARTRGGRLLTVVGGIIGGTIVISMLTSLFMGSLQTTFGEERVLYVVRYKRWQKARLDAAVNLIKAAWQRHRLLKSHNGAAAADRKLFKYMQQVRNLRLGAVSDGDDVVGKVREWKNDSLKPLLATANAKRNRIVDDLESKVGGCRGRLPLVARCIASQSSCTPSMLSCPQSRGSAFVKFAY